MTVVFKHPRICLHLLRRASLAPHSYLSVACLRTRAITASSQCHFSVDGRLGLLGGGGCLRRFERAFSSAGPSAGRVVPFLLSDIGEGIVEVVVKEWYVAVGDSVCQFDNICEVQSDKASVTITSRYDGLIRRLYCDVDQMARVGEPLVDIQLTSNEEENLQSSSDGVQHASGDTIKQSDVGVTLQSDETSAVQPRRHADTTPPSDSVESSRSPIVPTPHSTVHTDSPSWASSQGAATPTTDQARVRILATPAVRRLAAEHGVALSQVTASGRDGRVLKEDFLRHLQQQGQPSVTAVADVEDSAQAPADRDVPISGFTRAMFGAMTRALSVPHFGYCDEFDVTALVNLRRRLARHLDGSSGEALPLNQNTPVRLSFMPFVLKACSLALLQFPQVNAWLLPNSDTAKDWQQYRLVYRGSHDLGVAMDTPCGLVVPCIERVQQLSIVQLAERLNQLQQLGSAGQLSPKELRQPSLTVSNIGAVGGTYAQPVIASPQVAIGAVGRIQKLPRFSPEGAVVAAHIMPISWAADHRVLDGATLARFSNLVKQYLECPDTMLLYLK